MAPPESTTGPLRVACLGTRAPHHLPREWVDLFVGSVRQFAREGAVIHSAATPGSDRMAAENALRVGGQVRIYIPWPAFEQEWVERMVRNYPDQVTLELYDDEKHAAWGLSVRDWHPQARFLAPAMIRLYGRIYGCVTEADMLIALPLARRGPKAEVDKGGTDQGLHVARQHGIELLDLSEETSRQLLATRLARARAASDAAPPDRPPNLSGVAEWEHVADHAR